MSQGELSQEDIDALLSRAAERARKAFAEKSGPVPERPSEAPTRRAPVPEGARADLDALLDVPVELTVRLGEAVMPVEEILALREGSVVELDRPAGAPVDILVNDRLVARGEVVVVEDRFTVRVTEILEPPRGA